MASDPLVKHHPKSIRLILTVFTPLALAGAFVALFVSFEIGKDQRFTVRKTALAASVRCEGQLWWHRVAWIKAPVKGRVEQVLVKVGEKVREGQVLMYMSSNEATGLLDIAQSKNKPTTFAEMRQIFRPVPVLAAFSGFLFQVNVSPGQSFTESDGLFAIADEIIVNAQVAETVIPKIHAGEKVSVVINALPEKKVTAQILDVPLEGYEPIGGIIRYTVRMISKDLPDGARIGMSTLDTIEYDHRDRVLAVPTDAIRMKDGHSVVLVASGLGWSTTERIVETDLVTGPESPDGDLTEVTSGLKEGDVVMVPRQNQNDSSLERDLLEAMGGDPVGGQKSGPNQVTTATAGSQKSLSKGGGKARPHFHGG